MALANRNFAELVRSGRDDATITIGLQANCNDLLGMLAGLKYDDAGNASRIGLVFIDAHGDFNVPETTLSGMLGGMPVAIAAGHALHNLRNTAGLTDPVPVEHIVWGGVRDLDPLERERFNKYEVQQFSVDDIRELSPRTRSAYRRNWLPASTPSTYTSTWTFWTRRKCRATDSPCRTAPAASSWPKPSRAGLSTPRR